MPSHAKSKDTLRIATRNSPLALWQANYVRAELLRLHPGLMVEVVGFTTTGDRILDRTLSKVGGKGLFVKELEQALLDNAADIAVHSMKDVPMALPPGLHVPVICEREDPSDALVCADFANLDALPAGARVGTASLRRQCQLRSLYPDLNIAELRGNVNTRLAKLDRGDYAAIILASAGLLRLGMGARIKQKIPLDVSLPAVGQGAIGIEARAEDLRTLALIEPLHHRQTALCVEAERAVNRALEGGCQVPVASYAQLHDGQLQLRALVGSVDGKIMLHEDATGDVKDGEAMGLALAKRLLARGADRVLASVIG